MHNENLSYERKKYLSGIKRQKLLISGTRIFLLFSLIAIWETAGRLKLIDTFVLSQPSRIIGVLVNYREYGLLNHIFATFFETAIGFLLGIILGLLIAVSLWWSKFLSKVFEPFLVVLNSLPKIALGPVIIIWAGASVKAIIFMALAISTIVTVLEMLSGFKATDSDLIKMARTFGADRMQIFFKIVLPYNISTLFNSFKINIGLSLVGVIAGEFLVSKQGLGYLIVYGGQVFKMDLVMASVFILAVGSALIYEIIVLLEKTVLKYIVHK